jgi:hypothetical protein
MTVEVVIPALRNPLLLLESLERQSVPPNWVTIVSNEVVPEREYSYPLRVLNFSSDAYCYGNRDVVLRRNVGAWSSTADILIFQDDDQVAPRTLIESSLSAIGEQNVIWGHHRFVDCIDDWETLLDASPETGRPREYPPNSKHAHYSCYAGMLVVRRDYFIRMKGFDMAFLGIHAGEDQDLGRRMLIEQGVDGVFIHEPPFAWHGLGRGSYLPPRTNSCGAHETYLLHVGGRPFEACRKCPYRARADDNFDGSHPVIPYDPANVEVTLYRPRRFQWLLQLLRRRGPSRPS